MSTVGEDRARRTLQVAARIAEVLSQHEIPSAIIGAAALAAHGYLRYTEDLDLATDTDPFTKLRAVERSLQQEGFEVELLLPDAEDPLGGVLTVRGEGFEPVQVVNFQNPWHRGCGLLASESLREAQLELEPGSSLRVVGLSHLIALKLYAGGWKSKMDILELLERNRESLDLAALRSVCHRHGLGPALEPLLKELGFEPASPA